MFKHLFWLKFDVEDIDEKIDFKNQHNELLVKEENATNCIVQ